MKTFLKRTIKRTLANIPTGSMDHARILTYHSVGARDHDMNVHPDDFSAQMEWLSTNRTVVPLRDVSSLRPGDVAITFDDGYRDNLLNAAPVLHRLGLPATVFVVAGAVGATLSGRPQLRDEQILDWPDLRHLLELGWGIGGHSVTHRRLSALRTEEQRNEIAGCRTLLQDRLGIPIDLFAYPYGSALDFGPAALRLVQEAGYKFAFSNRYGPVCSADFPFAVRRIWVDRTDDLDLFKAKVEGRLDALAVFDTRAGIWARRALNRIST